MLNTRRQHLWETVEILVFLLKDWGKGMKLASHAALKVVQGEIRTGTYIDAAKWSKHLTLNIIMKVMR